MCGLRDVGLSRVHRNMARTLVCAVCRDRRRSASGHVMSRALGALAARTIGRRVRLAGGVIGTVSRVDSRGYVVTVRHLGAADVTFLDD